MRLLPLFATCLLAACTRTPTPAHEGASPADAAAAPGVAASATATAANELQRFLSAQGEDIEACFADLPALERDPASASFEGRGDLPATEAGRLMVAIDASGSMAGKAGGTTKMQAAKDAARVFLEELPQGVSVGLVAFGHRGSNREADKAASCAAVETVSPLGAVERERIGTALRGFDATGWTPLASAIEQAGRALGPSSDGAAQAIYVVSDGEDTCGGDPVAAARALREGGTQAIVNIIGFDLAAADRAQLKAVADAGGGTFVEVSADRAASLADELRRSNRNFAQRLRASNATFGRTLRNSNRTHKANLDLSNCVFARSLKESNRASAWAREQKLGDRGADRAFEDAVEARHDAFESRVEAYAEAADAAKDGVNAKLRSAQDRIDREAEAQR